MLKGEKSPALEFMKQALTIFEHINSPLADETREKLAEWRGEKGAGSVSNG